MNSMASAFLNSTPLVAPLSYIEFRGQKVLLKEAIETAGDRFLGPDVMSREKGWNLLCKFFDNLGPIPHHLHQNNEFAARVGRKGKPEAYYFPPQYNFKDNNFPYTFMGLNPGTTKDEIRRCLERWNEGDNGILYHSRAYKLKPGSGWQIDPGILHAPGSLVTYEPQVNSDVFAMYQSLVEGRGVPWDLLVKDVPEEHHNDLDYLIEMMDWEANTDPEFDAPVITGESMRLNFTNEGGVAGTTRLLKNVMGLWMLQGCRRSWATRGREYDHASLLDEAMKEPAFSVLIDPDHASFLNPADMPEAIDAFCRKTEQPRPGSPGAYTRAILESLALKYRAVVEGIEVLTGKRIMQIRVIGGGSKNRVLNQFTADATGRRVLAGPSEAAVLGNLGVQMLATGAAGSLKEVRAIIDRSFPTEIYEPADSEAWQKHVERFEHYCEFTYA
jgi:hypothetical protein